MVEVEVGNVREAYGMVEARFASLRVPWGVTVVRVSFLLVVGHRVLSHVSGAFVDPGVLLIIRRMRACNVGNVDQSFHSGVLSSLAAPIGLHVVVAGWFAASRGSALSLKDDLIDGGVGLVVLGHHAHDVASLYQRSPNACFVQTVVANKKERTSAGRSALPFEIVGTVSQRII